MHALQRIGFNLRLAAGPAVGKGIADQAAGLAAVGPRYDGAGGVRLGNFLFVVFMSLSAVKKFLNPF